MYREIFEGLEKWREEKSKKLLYLFGERFVGKTYTLKRFGEVSFTNVAYFDLEYNKEMLYVLDDSIIDEERFNELVRAEIVSENISENTLLIIENIGEISDKEKVLKWLNERKSWRYIAITSRKNEENILKEMEDYSSYLQCLKLNPISFKEFLMTMSRDDLVEKIKQKKTNDTKIRGEILSYLKKYIYVGGMPKAVSTYRETGSMVKVRKAKESILKDYMGAIEEIRDFSLRYKVKVLWKSVGDQLEKDNKKFQYGVAKPSARSREYIAALKWLENNKLVKRVHKVGDARFPLGEKAEEKSFECYLSDVGILCEIYNLDYETIAECNNIAELKNAAIVEQFVYQELVANGKDKLYYWKSGATSRIEFIFEKDGEIRPVEINLLINGKAQSMRVYKAKYSPAVSYSITSDKYEDKEDCLRIPLYMLSDIE